MPLAIGELIRACWQPEAASRPSFHVLSGLLLEIYQQLVGPHGSKEYPLPPAVVQMGAGALTGTGTGMDAAAMAFHALMLEEGSSPSSANAPSSVREKCLITVHINTRTHEFVRCEHKNAHAHMDVAAMAFHALMLEEGSSPSSANALASVPEKCLKNTCLQAYCKHKNAHAHTHTAVKFLSYPHVRKHAHAHESYIVIYFLYRIRRPQLRMRPLLRF